jgi:type II secretory pathway pseudopilin PulG
MTLVVARRALQKMAANMQIGSKLQLGFTYMGLLMVVAIAGIGLAGVGIVWHQDAQREREKELLFIGDAYRKAITSYYESGFGSKQFPASLDDLILDKRSPTIKRHIRKLYADPMVFDSTRDKPWGLVLQQGQIVGVHTLSEDKPVKKSGFSAGDEVFAEAEKYSDWKFIYAPSSSPANAATANANL